MQKMKFWKMSGAGNDFVLISGGRRDTVSLKNLAVRLCPRGASVGADGLLYVNRSGSGRVSVRYFNADGSEAFCGNGSRCAALWSAASGLTGRRLVLSTLAGELKAETVSAGSVEMQMPDVRVVRRGLATGVPGEAGRAHFLDTGAPHAVVRVKSVEKADVAGLGRRLRHNRIFGRRGANVNFAEVRGRKLLVRTYERGVENETLACGTGITASAIALVVDGALRSPVSAVARSGDRFRIRFSPDGNGASGIYVLGPARIVFKGEIS